MALNQCYYKSRNICALKTDPITAYMLTLQLWKSGHDRRNVITWKGRFPPLKANGDLCHLAMITTTFLIINVLKVSLFHNELSNWGISTPTTSFCSEGWTLRQFSKMCYPFFAATLENHLEKPFRKPEGQHERLTCYWLHLRLLN